MACLVDKGLVLDSETALLDACAREISLFEPFKSRVHPFDVVEAPLLAQFVGVLVVLALLDQVKIVLRVDDKELIVRMVLLVVVIELQAEYLAVKPREDSLRGGLPFFKMPLLAFVVGDVDFLEDGQFNQGCSLRALVFLDVVKEALFRSFISFDELLLA